MPPSNLRLSLAAHLGEVLTPEVAARIEAGAVLSAAPIRAAEAVLVNNDEHALALLDEFRNLCEVWDDAIDGEKNETDEAINRAFEFALFGMHANRFYRQHATQLHPALRTCIANWRAANTLERSKRDEHLITAWTLRCAPYDLFVAVALAAGGQVHADAAALYYRGLLTVDQLDEYLAEHMLQGEA